jgi:uncharacterized beta-barrel protein YwiB (DUF1934 family)
MVKDVIISVTGNQKIDNDTAVIELHTEGKLCRKNGVYYIIYKESEVTGMEGTTTMLKMEDKIVTIVRKGKVNSQMVFEEGKKNVSYYDTSLGAFSMGIFTTKSSVDIDDDGGIVTLKYKVEINSQTAGNNFFDIKVRKAGLSNVQYS